MTFYPIGWFSSICLLHGLVIAKSNFQKSADQFQQKIDQLIFGNWILQSLNHINVKLKQRFLIKSGYYIVPSPSTALQKPRIFAFILLHILFWAMEIPAFYYVLIFQSQLQSW